MTKASKTKAKASVTPQELLAAAEEFERQEGETLWGSLVWNREPQKTAVGDVTGVEHFGGEGKGDEYWVVFRIGATGQLFRVDGYYSSWEGTDWDEATPFEVEAVPVTKVEYHLKKD